MAPRIVADKVQDQRLKDIERELQRQREDLAAQQKTLQRQKKQLLALEVHADLDGQVKKKIGSLFQAAGRIGNAYAVAANNHNKAVANQEKVKALEEQKMFAILTVLTSGGLSWVTELVKTEKAAAAASRIAAMNTLVEEARISEAWGTVAALELKASKLKDVLNQQVSEHALMTDRLKTVAAAGLGKVLSPDDTSNSAPPPSEPASIDPDLFRGKLEAQIRAVEHVALNFLSALATKIRNCPEEAWDNYDDSQFQAAFRDWQNEANKLADADDLPKGDEVMANELERLIWALWIPRLRQVETWGSGCHYKSIFNWWCDSGGKSVEYVKVYDPVDNRFVALGIENQSETNDDRETEDKRVIRWAEAYMSNLKPWVGGKKG